MNYLEQKTALVTGAGRGIGRAIAVALGARGVRVCCVSRTKSEVAESVHEIERDGGRGIAVTANVTRERELQDAFAAAREAFGAVHIVIANAGTNLDRNPIESSCTADFVATVEVNLIGAYLTVKTAIPYLRDSGGGHIVSVGSGLGLKGTAGTGAYACSKAGLHIMTQVLSEEVKPLGIAVNELIPGPVRTELTRPVWDRSDYVFQTSEWIKEPHELTPLLLTLLAMDPSRSPTGQTFSLMARVV